MNYLKIFCRVLNITVLRIAQNVSSLFYLFPIGKVAIKKEDLCNHSGKETWFSLQPIDSNSEVQVNIKT